MGIKIYIDQGHNPGNINAGTSGNGIIEAEVTYQVGIYLAALLYTNPNFEVRVSRPYQDSVLGNDQTSSLQERVRQANEWPADYFISIHVNSNTNHAIHGSEVYVYKNNSEAYWLGSEVLNSIVKIVGTRYNQVRVNPSLYVLRHTAMPAILVELAYLSNFHDAEKLLHDQFAFAFAIYIGIIKFFRLPYPQS